MQSVRTYPPLHGLFTAQIHKEHPDCTPTQLDKARTTALADLHTYMDIRLRHAHAALTNAITTRDTGTFLRILYSAIEESFIDHLHINRADRTAYKSMLGRGTPTFQTSEIQDPAPMTEDQYTTSKDPLAQRTNHALRLARQLTTVARYTPPQKPAPKRR